MKVTEESFSFHHERKRTEDVRYQKNPNFQIKEPLPDRTLESFIEAKERKKKKGVTVKDIIIL